MKLVSIIEISYIVRYDYPVITIDGFSVRVFEHHELFPTGPPSPKTNATSSPLASRTRK